MATVIDEGTGWERAMRYENERLAQEQAEAERKNRCRAAASMYIEGVPPRFKQAMQAGQQRVAQAQRTIEQVKQDTIARIKRDGGDDEQANRWMKDALTAPSTALNRAAEQLDAATVALGEQNLAWSHYTRLTIVAPERKAGAEKRYLAELDAIDREILLARAQCATE